MSQDITERKQLEALREEFAAIVVHDLRTPLQSVLLQVEMLLRQASGDAATVPITALTCSTATTKPARLAQREGVMG